MQFEKLFNLSNDEKMFENTVENGGLTSILMKVCAIGDSLASGETELLHKDGQRSYHDKFEFSWGQFMARDAGIEVLNLSHGGQTAKNMINEAMLGARYFTDIYRANAYIIALGVNDIMNSHQELGEPKDMYDEDKDTFAHYYGRIVKWFLQVEPNARFFFVTMPKCINDDEVNLKLKKAHADLLHAFTKEIPHTFVLDLFNEAPMYGPDFFGLYFLNGHLNAAGYRVTAQLFESGIDYIIRHNMDEFREFALMGHPEYDEELSH